MEIIIESINVGSLSKLCTMSCKSDFLMISFTKASFSNVNMFSFVFQMGYYKLHHGRLRNRGIDRMICRHTHLSVLLILCSLSSLIHSGKRSNMYIYFFYCSKTDVNFFQISVYIFLEIMLQDKSNASDP